MNFKKSKIRSLVLLALAAPLLFARTDLVRE